MRYSLVNGIKTEATPKLSGVCICCGAETIPKCGRFKVHHWAHKNKQECDPWWENESEWHRSWKRYFPTECQEIVFEDPNTSEKHIADVYTADKRVIEIQSYSIDDAEARIRENFYGNMIWIVNGNTNHSNRVYFGMSLCGPHPNDYSLRDFRWIGQGKLFAKWSASTKPVYLDFGDDAVWELLSFDLVSKNGQVRVHNKQEFIKLLGGKCT